MMLILSHSKEMRTYPTVSGEAESPGAQDTGSPQEANWGSDRSSGQSSGYRPPPKTPEILSCCNEFFVVISLVCGFFSSWTSLKYRTVVPA